MSPQKRIPAAQRKATRRTLTALERIEAAAVREQLALLRSLRRAVLAGLAEAAGFRLFHLTQILGAIEREIAAGRDRAQAIATGRTRAAYGLGQDLVDRVLVAAGLNGGLADLSTDLLAASLDVTNDRLRGIWSELGTRLKTIVRQASLGVEDPFQAIQAAARIIRDPKVFGTALNRAEVIVRTEVNRTFSLAAQRRMEQSNRRLGGGLKKWWLTAEDARVRPSHGSAGDRYRPESSPGPIPVTQPFEVGDARLMFPRDPRGSAKETVNCRCVSVPYVQDVEAAAALPKTA